MDGMSAAALAPGETVRIRDQRWVVTRQTPGVSAPPGRMR